MSEFVEDIFGSERFSPLKFVFFFVEPFLQICRKSVDGGRKISDRGVHRRIDKKICSLKFLFGFRREMGFEVFPSLYFFLSDFYRFALTAQIEIRLRGSLENESFYTLREFLGR